MKIRQHRTVVYVLPHPDFLLYGTERMVLATLLALSDRYHTLLITRPGPVLDEARRMGIETLPVRTLREFAWHLLLLMAQVRELTILTIEVRYALVTGALRRLLAGRAVHIAVEHGGQEEAVALRRAGWLNRSGAQILTVSYYMKQRMVAHGVREDRIAVLPNFLAPDRAMPLWALSREPRPVRRVVAVSRLAPVKRLDVLLEAMTKHPELELRVLGAGELLETYRKLNPRVTFAGYVDDLPAELAAADIFVHCCPTEPFGLVVLEAMAAAVPVLVPDEGGAAELVDDGRTGFLYRAGDPDALAARLREITAMPPAELRELGARGRLQSAERYSAAGAAKQLGTLIEGCRSVTPRSK